MKKVSFDSLQFVLPSLDRLIDISTDFNHPLKQKAKDLVEALEDENQKVDLIAFLYIWISFELFKIEN